MANTLQVKRSAVAAKVPTVGQLLLGELAVNTYDGTLFLKKNDGTESIVTIKPVTKANIEAELTGTITSHSHATASHTHGNVTNAGAIGSTANLPVITTTSGVLTTGTFGTVANSFCQGNDSRLSDARTPTAHAHGNITNTGYLGTTAAIPLITGTSGIIQAGSFGTASGTFCQGNDSRLSDARTPTSHAHGNITSAGAIGSTATLPIITGASGVLQAGSFGTAAGTFCQGNDARLSDARTPTAHTHGNITNAGAIGTTANLPVITTTSGVLTAGSFGTEANTFCQGNDARLSDARTPTTHTHSEYFPTAGGTVSGNVTVTGYIDSKLRKSYEATTALSTSGAVTLDFATGNGKYHWLTGNTQFTMANSVYTSCMLVLLGNAGAYTITWPSGIKWPRGVAPVLTSGGSI